MKDIITWIDIYVDNLWPDYKAGRIKRGGTSAMEGIIANYFSLLFPNAHIRRNFRPDTLRGKSNRPLELDIFLPEERIAIEIQGPRHSEEAVAERDQLKRERCHSHGIALISIDWNRARNELLSSNLNDVLRELRFMVASVREAGDGYYFY